MLVSRWFYQDRGPKDWQKSRPTDHIVCGDLTRISVQAGSYSYCDPRENNADEYTEMEVALSQGYEGPLLKYADDLGICAYVPTEEIVKAINHHGGYRNSVFPGAKGFKLWN
jgi:hypothetical protein